MYIYIYIHINNISFLKHNYKYVNLKLPKSKTAIWYYKNMYIKEVNTKIYPHQSQWN